MNKRVFFLIAVFSITASLAYLAGVAGAGPLAKSDAPNSAPSVVSYQGQVTTNGTPYNGTGYFKFAIVNQAGDTSYWSNDGTSTADGEPTSGTPLPVTSGLFNVLLGDTALTNMTQSLTPSVFSGANRYLRVWFSSDNVDFQLLSPDQRIAAVPFALQAQIAVDADTLDGQQASEFASAGHPHAGLLPTGALVLSPSDNDTTLIAASFSYTGRQLFNIWDTRAAMPTGRNELATASVDGVIYAIGGHSGVYETANEAYDPVTNSWSIKAPMLTGRRALAAAVVNGMIYAIGGESGSSAYETANEAYDPVSNSWSTKATLPTARRFLVAAAVDGIIYAIGGYSGAYEKVNEAYDPVSNSWSTKAPMPTGRRALAAAVVDGVIYAFGGYSGAYETANEAYDPVANSWSTKAPMTTGRRLLAAAAVDGVIYAIGGWSSSNAFETANQAYDPVSNSWSTKAPMPTGRTRLAAAAVDGVIYAIGGWSGTNETANEAYAPALYVYIKD